jgi:thiol-disulfide isomerase/thioredoxin
MRALVAALVLSIAAVGCGGDKSGGGDSGPAFSCDKVQPAGFPTSDEGVEVNDTLFDQSFEDMDVNTSCTRDFTGRVVFISIGTGWCPPCQAETPGFVEVYDEFKNDGFVILQVLFEDYDGGNPDPTFMQEWKDEYNIKHTLVPDAAEAFWQNLLPASNPQMYVPHNILLDKDGVIKYSNAGSMSEGNLRTRVNALVSAEPQLDHEE